MCRLRRYCQRMINNPLTYKLNRFQDRGLGLQHIGGILPENEDAAHAIRNLVKKIIVGHHEDGQLSLSVHGRLAALTEASDLYPNMRISSSGGSLVAF